MSEQDDNLFHDWVRQSLNTYRPPYDSQDWVQLQRTLKRKQWWRNGFIGSGVLLLIGLLSWFVLSTQTKNLATHRSTGHVFKKSVPRKSDTTIVPQFQQSLILNGVDESTTASIEPAHKPRLSYSAKPVYRPSVESVTFLSSQGRVSPLASTLTEQIRSATVVAFSPEELPIKQQMMTDEFGSDSTSYRILERNLRRWPKAVLVCDLTSSMYPYTTQLFTLLKQYAHNPSIQGVVFFTDCDSLGQQTYEGGPPGRMFITHERNVVNTLPVLLNAARNTVRNKDDAENDVEALLVAQKEFPDANHLILVADNMSTVKDMSRLNSVKKPVHVMLCGTTGSDTALAFQSDYYVIANQTNGSLHTLEDDLSPRTISSNTTLRVGTRYYHYSRRKKQFKLTGFTHRPKRFLDFIWL